MHNAILAAATIVGFNLAPVLQAQEVIPPPVMPDIQTPSGELTAPLFVPHPLPGQVLASNLVGTSVMNADGENLGEVTDVVLATDGTPYALVIGVGSFLGIGEKQIGVAFHAISSTVDAKGMVTLTLNATKEELDAAPAFDATAMTAPPDAPVPEAPSPSVPVLPISPAPNPAG